MKKILTTAMAVIFTLTAFAQCQADFGYTNAANTFSFSDSSTTSSGNIVGWAWQFGDNTAPATQQNPQHTYEACGYYEVTLTIFTSTFCSSSFSDTVFVSQGTVPSFTYTVDTTNGDVNFQAAPFSTTLEYNWNFGDSTSGTGINTTHNYAAGTYVACLTISDTGGFCTYTICDTVNVYIAPPNCSASWTANMISSGQYAFTAQPFDQDWTYTWDYGDSSPLGNGFVTTHAYTMSGTYTVCLTVADSSTGCTSQFCDTLTVLITCNASWTNTSLIAGQQTFTAQPFNPSWSYTWDFGDATPLGNGFITNHTYISAGTYTVCLTVYDSATTCTSQFCDTVNVIFPTVCPVSFTNVYLAGNMTFTPTPFNPLSTYTWDFGDASAPQTGIVSSHAYAAPGTYTVCVTMNTFDGCTSTFCDTVIVPSTIGVEEWSAAINTLRVAPNPAADEVRVSYELNAAQEVQLSITDISGRIVLQQQLNGAGGANSEMISLEQLETGAYIITLTAGDDVSQLPLIVQ